MVLPAIHQDCLRKRLRDYQAFTICARKFSCSGQPPQNTPIRCVCLLNLGLSGQNPAPSCLITTLFIVKTRFQGTQLIIWFSWLRKKCVAKLSSVPHASQLLLSTLHFRNGETNSIPPGSPTPFPGTLQDHQAEQTGAAYAAAQHHR